jgi:hypothetical protein
MTLCAISHAPQIGPLDEIGQALEGADDLVAPARLAGLVVVAGVLADLGAEDVRRELGEVVAVEDEAVGLVDLRELAAARAEEQQVGDQHRAGEDRRTAGGRRSRGGAA